MEDPLINMLASNNTFGGLSTAELQHVRSAGTMRRFEPGSFILRQGEPADNLYLMFCGCAKLTHVTVEGHQILQRFVRPGDSYGIAAALPGCEFAWSLQAIDECIMLVWSSEVLAELTMRYTTIMRNMLRISLFRRREMNQRYLALRTSNVEQRLAQALLQLCQEVGTDTSEGCIIDVTLSRGDIAEYAGASVYSVSRTLKRWERQGWIRAQRERITVLRRQSLQDLLGVAV